MKKLIALILTAVLGALLFAGCTAKENSHSSTPGSSSETPSSDTGSSEPDAAEVEPKVTQILDAVSKVVTIPQGVVIDDADTILMNYDLDTDKIEEMALLKAGSGANADEIMVLKLKDSADEAAITDAFSLRLNVLTDIFKDYTPEDMPKIENAQSAKNGKYHILAVCENPDDAIAAFQSCFQK